MHTKVKHILDQISNSYQAILKDNLVGIYVHGSIAFDCFTWEKSDIDFLVVTKDVPSLVEKEELIKVLLELDDICPPKGMEMSLVLDKYCTSFVYPTPFELHFSNMHKEKCKQDLERYCTNMNGTDKDLAAHFTVTREVGITLYGRDKKTVFGPVPKKDYIDSIKYDIEDVQNDFKTEPMYFVLTLCRVLAYVQDSLVVSKKQGGEWGIKNLPVVYRDIIEKAQDCYASDKAFDGDMQTVKNFVQYMIEQIKKFNK